MPRDIIRGHFRACKTSRLYSLTVGDSINNIYSSTNMQSHNIGRMQIGCLGQVSGFRSPGITNNAVYSSEPSVTNLTAGGLVRPGEAWPQTGEVGMGVRPTLSYYASGNIADYTPIFQMAAYPSGPWDTGWPNSTHLDSIVKARSSTTSLAQSYLEGYSQDSSPTVRVNLTYVPTLNAAATYKYLGCTNFATNSQNTSAPTFTSFCIYNTGVETENGTTVRDLALLDFGLRNRDKTAGVFWGTSGYGSWRPENHATATGASITADPPTYTGKYSDAALAADYTAYSWNHVFIWIGANPSQGDTAIGGPLYKSEVLAIIARHRAAALAAGLPNPKFTLVSQYVTSSAGNEPYMQTLCQALYEIALADKDTEFVDLYGYMQATYGPWASWQATYLADGVHPNATGRNVLSDRMSTVLLGGNIPSPTAPAATGGPRTVSKLAMIGKGRVYRSAA